jgi:hypothetical protein
MKMELRVWWIPQVPGSPFIVEVSTVTEGVLIMDTLARYDMFQFENNIKPDYCNAGGLGMFEDGEWVDWCDEETGIDDPEEYLEYLKEK